MLRPASCSALLTLALVLLPTDRLVGQEDRYRLSVSRDAVYQVPFEEVAGDQRFSVSSDWLTLWWGNEAVPVWVEDGGDGYFGPGDWVEFFGEHLPGDHTYYNPHTRDNVYWLQLDRARTWMPPRQSLGSLEGNRVPTFKLHHEPEEIKVRFAGGKDGVVPDEWYWSKMTPIDREPLLIPLDLRSWQREHGPVRLSIALQGWSKPRHHVEGLADHRVEVWWNEQQLAAAEWNGHEPYLLELPPLAPELLTEPQPAIELRVPRRQKPDGEAWVDVVLLDWMEVEFPAEPWASSIARWHFEDGAGGSFRLDGDHQGLVLYGEKGGRFEFDSATTELPVPEGDRWVYVVEPGTQLPVERLEADQPSNLTERTAQVDYLMIAHERLMAAVEPLAEFHRNRGLTVEVVDVQDLFDEFNGGRVGPQAIRDFIADAYQRRIDPSPRFVLLVGDASWDPRGVESAEDQDYSDWTFRGSESRPFVKNGSTSYEQQADRNLVPARPFQSYEGHAAADNWFVSVEGDDYFPDLAIGRLPVTTPQEVEAIVAKTMRYVEESEVGPWRRQVLWITNEQAGMQRSSDQLADRMAARGFTDRRVYPRPEEEDNSLHQATLKNAFSEGNLFVHFLGHGGRYIWRTGPPDFSKDHDLFTLDHLDELAPTNNLPIILSMTCYSAPFDHPTADSIGEKFLRLADRGAVAVLAASWRNSPGRQFSERLFEELTKPDGTIGEAIQHAKRGIRSQVLVETYNLLGDPAVPVALPAAPVELRQVEIAGQPALELDPAGMTGQALFEWLDAEGEIVASHQEPVAGLPLRVSEPLETASATQVRVYAWDPSERRDGIALLDLDATHFETADQGR